MIIAALLHGALFADSYRLFLGTYDASHPQRARKNAQEAVEKAAAAGIETEVVTSRNKKGTFLIVQTAILPDKKAFLQLKSAAERAHLDFFVKQYDTAHKPVSGQREVKPAKLHKAQKSAKKSGKRSAAQTESDPFFGSNETMVEILEGGLALKEKMLTQKGAYLKHVSRAYRDSGLSLKLVGERAINSERNGFETAIVWDLLGGGLLQKRGEVRRMQIEKGIRFDSENRHITENYRELALYEIEAIKNRIQRHFSGMRVALLEKMRRYARKRLREGYLTQDRYEAIKSAYTTEHERLLYYESVTQKRFDRRYRSLIAKIEKVRLLPPVRLQEEALQKSLDLQILKERLALIGSDGGWQKRVRADIYLNRKEYTFIDRRETLAGMHLKIPFNLLDDGDEKEMEKIEKEQLQRKIESEEMLLKRRVLHAYDAVRYRQNRIVRLSEAIAKERKTIALLRKREKLALSAESGDTKLQKLEHRLQILALQRERWLLRAEILEELATLQYLTGIRIL